MAVEQKHRLSVLVNEAAGTPTLVQAVEVEYDGGWDDKSGGEIFTMTKVALPFTTNVYWYYADIDVTGHYTIKIDGLEQTGYIGKFIEVGSTYQAVAANTAHRMTESSNPHNVTQGDVGLGNVDNYSAANQVINGISVARIVASGIDLADIPDAGDRYAESSELAVEQARIAALESDVDTIETNLTIPNLVNAILASDSTLEALAAILQTSNILAEKVAAALAE